MATRPHWVLGVALLAALAFAGSGPAMGVEPCKASQLTGTFKVILGSPGAGSISYRLRLTNTSGPTCFVSGLVGLRLLSKTGKPLPTKVTPVFQPGLTAVKVTLRHGKAAKADARFSPDIPGPGEPQTGAPCEPKAYKVRVTVPPGGGTLLAPVLPATKVCVHGNMSVRALSAA